MDCSDVCMKCKQGYFGSVAGSFDYVCSHCKETASVTTVLNASSTEVLVWVSDGKQRFLVCMRKGDLDRDGTCLYAGRTHKWDWYSKPLPKERK